MVKKPPFAGRQQAFLFSGEIKKQVHLPFLVYLPKDYDTLPHRDFPLILFLHGSGERGTPLEKVKKNGLPALLETQDLPFVVVSPQCPADRWWDPEALDVLLDQILASYRIDRDRIYLTGLSMGGFGTWETAIRFPDRFAAIAPVCAIGMPLRACIIQHIPVWMFHGEADPIISSNHSVEMANALRKCGAHPRLTLYPGVEHEAWIPAYSDPELYSWFLSHKRMK